MLQRHAKESGAYFSRVSHEEDLQEPVPELPLTERWKQQSYQYFKLPLNEFIEREKKKKDLKVSGIPLEMANFIEACIKEKERIGH